MQETKDTQSPESSGGNGESKAPDSDATSSETLSDVEKTEKDSGAESDTGGSSMPSPDGAFDSNQGGDSPKDDPGPM
ncbi:MAG: hypothetical protein H7Y30_08425 [Pyrinomonadaceae bacterium]|nr:hypothetical protein [Pyrinomonadaceae bacterium]